MKPTTYRPPARPEQLPTTHEAWRQRTGLTDPAVIAVLVERRLAAIPGEPRYADFFHAA